MKIWVREHRIGSVGAIIFAITLFLRTPSLFLHPRFWAEEATYYWLPIHARSWAASLVFIYNGNLQILENVAVKISTMAPIRFSAFPTTYISFIFATGCCFYICSFMKKFDLPPYSSYLFSAIFALSPAGYEIFLNSTNIQWIASIIMFFMCFEHDVDPSRAIGRYAAIFFLSLSGPAACLTVFVYAAWFVFRPSLYKAFSLVALCGGCIVEAIVLIAHRQQVIGRAFHASPDSLIAYVFQVFFTNLLPSSLLDNTGEYLRVSSDRWSSGMGFQIALLGCISIVCVGATATQRLPLRVVAVMIVSSCIITLINIFGAIGDGADAMMSGFAGGRYFALANTCTIFLVCVSLSASDACARNFARILLVLMACNLTLTALFGKWTNLFVTGVSVGTQVEACGEQRPCHIQARPGPPWTVDLP